MERIKTILTQATDIVHFVYGFAISIFKYFKTFSVYFYIVAILGYLTFFLYQQFERENKIEGICDMVEFFCGYVLGNIMFN